jgi:hypothetical protein
MRFGSRGWAQADRPPVGALMRGGRFGNARLVASMTDDEKQRLQAILRTQDEMMRLFQSDNDLDDSLS